MYGLIYKCVNLVNGKIYIGQTVLTLKKRIKSHYNSHKKPKNVFHKALKKHGFENFKWDVIDHADSQEELDIKEIQWVEHYRTYLGYEDCNGYNSTTGGRTNYLFSNQTLDKMSKSQAKWIEENGHPKGMLGKKHTKETIEKFKEIHKRGSNGNSKSIVKLDKKGEFISRYDCMRDASDDLNLETEKNIDAVPHITSCCKGDLRTAYGYVWMYQDDYINNGARKLEKSKCEKAVIQLTLSGDFVKKFETVKGASEEIGVLPRSLSRCLSGERATCKGHKWVYEKDYKESEV